MWKPICATLVAIFLWEHVARTNRHFAYAPSHGIGLATDFAKDLFYAIGYRITTAVGELVKFMNLAQLGQSAVALLTAVTEFAFAWIELFRGSRVAALMYDRNVIVCAIGFVCSFSCTIFYRVYGRLFNWPSIASITVFVIVEASIVYRDYISHCNEDVKKTLVAIIGLICFIAVCLPFRLPN